jgi:pimeloyl-ACP methyl ester carboxylesterase
MDQWAIRFACRFMDGGPAKVDARTIEEALDSLGAADFLAMPVPEAPTLRFTGQGRFQFTSPVQTPWAENNLVPGRLYSAGSNWRARPAVILLHGWNGERQYQWQFPYLSWRLNRVGVNAVMFELPYHGKRKPTAPGAVRNFISEDLFRVVEATRQSLCEVRSLVAWLKSQGITQTGIWGVSLGAWLAALVSGMDDNVAFAVFMTPIVEMDRALCELPFCAPIYRVLKNSSGRLDHLNLGSHLPRCRPDGVLIIKAEYDLFAPGRTVETFWQACEQPEIWRLPHGHISVLCSLPVMERVVRWIRHQAEQVSDRSSPSETESA